LIEEPNISEQGFTLVETLVALAVLAVSSGIFMQSIAEATSKLRTSNMLVAAELLAVQKLVEYDDDVLQNKEASGQQAETGLAWSYVETIYPAIGVSAAMDAAMARVEIRSKGNGAMLYSVSAFQLGKSRP
jgi:prepilin-type N-terminal cleavage/methylation domain-containing protein